MKLSEQEPTETQLLLDEVRTLNQHKFVRAHDSWIGLLCFQLIRGLAFGLGSVIGATLLVAILISFLGQMDFIPVIGDWAKQILDLLNTGNL